MDVTLKSGRIGIFMCEKCFHKIEYDVDLIEKAEPVCPDCNERNWKFLKTGFLKEYGSGSQKR